VVTTAGQVWEDVMGCICTESLHQPAEIAQLTFPFLSGSTAPSAESQELFIDYYTQSLTSTR